MHWTNDKSEAKERFLKNPGVWVHWFKARHERRIEDLKMDYNQRVYDEYNHFSEWAALAHEWGMEAGLLDINDTIFSIMEIPEDE